MKYLAYWFLQKIYFQLIDLPDFAFHLSLHITQCIQAASNDFEER